MKILQYSKIKQINSNIVKNFKANIVKRITTNCYSVIKKYSLERKIKTRNIKQANNYFYTHLLSKGFFILRAFKNQKKKVI